MVICPKCKSENIYIQSKQEGEISYFSIVCQDCNYCLEKEESLNLNLFVQNNSKGTEVEVNEFDAYLIHGRTGCSCCSYENFIEGIFLTLDEAKMRKDYHINNRTVASQYSRNGNYDIYRVHCKKFSNDDGIFVENLYYESNNFNEPYEYYSYGERVD